LRKRWKDNRVGWVEVPKTLMRDHFPGSCEHGRDRTKAENQAGVKLKSLQPINDRVHGVPERPKGSSDLGHTIHQLVNDWCIVNGQLEALEDVLLPERRRINVFEKTGRRGHVKGDPR
jgi:hypothetical protein